MKRLLCLLAFALCASSAFSARDGLESFLGNVNVRAQSDMAGFYATVSVQFGVPQTQVRTIHRTVSDPGIVFMIFQLGQMSGKPPEQVLKVYEHGRTVGKGWGMIAKELGIKPGSADFHALKRGDLIYGENGSAVRVNGQGKSQDNRGRGHGNDRQKHGEN